ncbi:DUF3347 domain-containing protein [Chitinophaga arvensicola]|uniref:DUF3347 domain-containing protein n=1 Tax=Chitinophaga arvensicola TaxID=29529 RepID=A0A1I0S9K9_9BACT|nr:DUF3347 domain-containing protein [Chitinophaga arvensicola]SEW51740.1 Protein of unknown function [Chitinophaga arvensicola]
MTILMKAMMPVLIAGLMAACNSGDTTKTAVVKDSVTAAPAPVAAAVRLKDDKLNAIYPHYVKLTAALINGDVAAARIAGNAIATGAGEIAGSNAVAAAAAKITASADLEAQRNIYAGLSNDLIALVKKTGMDSGALYVAFCPMAMNDKGASWLSAENEIRNPYFGEQMLTCGSVKETIQ